MTPFVLCIAKTLVVMEPQPCNKCYRLLRNPLVLESIGITLPPLIQMLPTFRCDPSETRFA